MILEKINDELRGKLADFSYKEISKKANINLTTANQFKRRVTLTLNPLCKIAKAYGFNVKITLEAEG